MWAVKGRWPPALVVANASRRPAAAAAPRGVATARRRVGAALAGPRRPPPPRPFHSPRFPLKFPCSFFLAHVMPFENSLESMEYALCVQGRERLQTAPELCACVQRCRRAAVIQPAAACSFFIWRHALLEALKHNQASPKVIQPQSNPLPLLVAAKLLIQQFLRCAPIRLCPSHAAQGTKGVRLGPRGTGCPCRAPSLLLAAARGRAGRVPRRLAVHAALELAHAEAPRLHLLGNAAVRQGAGGQGQEPGRVG